jgi:hypothetical protein
MEVLADHRVLKTLSSHYTFQVYGIILLPVKVSIYTNQLCLPIKFHGRS